MLFSNLTKRYLKLTLIIALFVGIALTGTGCEVLEEFAPAPPPAEEPAEVETPPAPTSAIATEDRAILEVYEHLLSQAGSHQAKAYLADFYTIGDNWNAKAELLKDGTILWYVTVDLTNIEIWGEKPHWQKERYVNIYLQASWLILDDSTVIPSNQFQANALRIEADLQELSPRPEPPPAGKPPPW
jgi:hypothetical protein